MRRGTMIGILAVCLNLFLVAVGLYYGLPAMRLDIADESTKGRSHEEIRALVEKTTDIEKLRDIIISDDLTIRADRKLASLVLTAVIVGSSVSVVVGIGNLVIFTLASTLNRRHETPTTR
jgi:hypothetical protein